MRAAAKRDGISPTTVQTWRSRQTSTDSRMGPKEPRSSVLSLEDDDRLYALQPSLPHLTRSSLHRCLQRHGISRLPDVDSSRAFITASPAASTAGQRPILLGIAVAI